MKRKNSLLTFGSLTAASALYLMLVTDAAAQNPRHCGPREIVVDRLAQGFGETRQSMGLGANNSVMEVFASDASGTWTITVTSPTGVTCLVASGQAFEELTEALPAAGNDA